MGNSEDGYFVKDFLSFPFLPAVITLVAFLPDGVFCNISLTILLQYHPTSVLK